MTPCQYRTRCEEYEPESLQCFWLCGFCKRYKTFKFQERQEPEDPEGQLEYWENQRIRLLKLAGRDREI